MTDQDDVAQLLAQLVNAAYDILFADADPTDVAENIGIILAGLDPDTALESVDMMELAELQTLISVAREPSRALLAWTRWAASTAEQRFGPTHRYTIRAATAMMDVLSWYHDSQAPAVQGAAVADPAEQASSPPAQTAALELRAIALHNAGHCQAGIDELVTVCRAKPSPPVRPRAEYLYQLAAMLTACKRLAEARLLLDQLDPDVPTTLGLIPTPIADVAWTHSVRCERQPHNNPEPGDPAGDFDWRTLL